MPYPNLIIAGAPKSGTSSLFDYLMAHPEVGGSNKKETRYFLDKGYPLFSKEYNYYNQGLNGYLDYFLHLENRDVKIIIEATPDYLYQTDAIHLIKNLPSNPKVLFILREPVERVYSLFRFAQNNMAVFPKHYSFSDYIKMATEESEQLNKNPLLKNAIQHSKYYEYLVNWIDVFGENVQCMVFEDMKNFTRDFLRAVSEKYEIDPCFYGGFDFSRSNATTAVKSQAVHKVARKLRNKPFFNKFWKLYINLNTGPINSVRSKEDLMALQKIKPFFKESNELIKKKLGLDLSSWE